VTILPGTFLSLTLGPPFPSFFKCNIPFPAFLFSFIPQRYRPPHGKTSIFPALFFFFFTQFSCSRLPSDSLCSRPSPHTPPGNRAPCMCELAHGIRISLSVYLDCLTLPFVFFSLFREKKYYAHIFRIIGPPAIITSALYSREARRFYIILLTFWAPVLFAIFALPPPPTLFVCSILRLPNVPVLVTPPLPLYLVRPYDNVRASTSPTTSHRGPIFRVLGRSGYPPRLLSPTPLFKPFFDTRPHFFFCFSQAGPASVPRLLFALRTT